MTKFEEMLCAAGEADIKVVEMDFLSSSKGVCSGNRIGIRKDMTDHEKACILAEELGHHELTVGNIIDQTDANNRKQENKARNWSFDRLFSLEDILAAHLAGSRNASEVAEFLGITPEFLQDALTAYRSRFGIIHKIESYLITINDIGYAITETEQKGEIL